MTAIGGNTWYARSIQLILTLLLISAALTFITASEATAASQCGNTDARWNRLDKPKPDRHPLVIVHGWTANAESMNATGAAIEKRMPKTFHIRLFDYQRSNTDWASSPRIAGCLADYINRLSALHRSVGGDGKVYVVAHSMGGLATRFASNGAYAQPPASQTALAGLTTIATPHEGSPFGNTLEGAAKETGEEFLKWISGEKALPGRSSDAARCLARHDGDRQLPHGCAYPPYLPASVAVGQISGDNVVRRTLFGIPLYDIDLRSDGVVSVDSATAYLTSGPPGAKSPRTPSGTGYMKDIQCTVTTDQSMTLMRSLDTPEQIIARHLEALGNVFTDSAAMDQVISGEPGIDLKLLMLAAAVAYPCGHNAMTTNTQSMDAVVESLRRQIAPVSDSAPTEIILRPFNVDGTAAPGWTVNAMNNYPIDCASPSPASSSSRSDGILSCSPTASSGDACYVADGQRTALCLIDPFSRTVVQYSTGYDVNYGASAPQNPTPIGITLDDGTTCRLRYGGAWPFREGDRNLTPFYGCQGADFRAVWSTDQNNGGISKSDDGWTVQVGGTDDPLTTHTVTEVLYVGTVE